MKRDKSSISSMSSERVQITLHIEKYLNNLIMRYAMSTRRTRSALCCTILEDWFNNAKNTKKLETSSRLVEVSV